MSLRYRAPYRVFSRWSRRHVVSSGASSQPGRTGYGGGDWTREAGPAQGLWARISDAQGQRGAAHGLGASAPPVHASGPVVSNLRCSSSSASSWSWSPAAAGAR